MAEDDSQNPLIKKRQEIINTLNSYPNGTVVTAMVNLHGADFLLSEESCGIGNYSPAGTNRNQDGLGRKKLGDNHYEVYVWRPANHA